MVKNPAMDIRFYYYQNIILGLSGLAIIAYSLCRHPARYPGDRRLFTALIVSNGSMILLDNALYLLSGQTYPGAKTLSRAVTALVFAAGPVPSTIWFTYIFKLTSRINLCKRSVKISLSAAILLNAGVAIASIGHGYFFRFDSTNHYQRGPYFSWPFVFAYVLLFLSILTIVKNRRMIRRQDRLTLILFSFFPMIGGVIQYLFWQLSIQWLFMMFGLLIFYFNMQSRALVEQKHIASQLENAFMRAQINPHFIFNAMNSIMAFCVVDQKKARELLQDFSNYLRSSFDFNHFNQLSTVEEELNLLQSYLNIQKAMYQDRLQVDLDIDPSLAHSPIVPLVIQPLVENAIQHGLMVREDGGSLQVRLSREGDDLILKVADNGIGMSEDQMASLDHPASRSFNNQRLSIGLRNIRQRVLAMPGSTMSIQSAIGNGTAITIRMFACAQQPGEVL